MQAPVYAGGAGDDLAPNAFATNVKDLKAGRGHVLLGTPIDLGAEEAAGQRAEQLGEPAEQNAQVAVTVVAVGDLVEGEQLAFFQAESR
ncbi:MAG: hypothetical protein ABI726_06855 [bacterium]